LREDTIPVLNGDLDTSWQIDGDTHRLEPVRGVTFDESRPVFSSTSSWLLGRNIVALDDASWNLVQLLDGSSSLGEVLDRYVDANGSGGTREEGRVLMEALCEEKLVLLRTQAVPA
ncbi:MAG: hypothetical protein VX519_08085, partial [Myxococcota bacterium]|nr:hypothetical protein [Myxococcota bacterium]